MGGSGPTEKVPFRSEVRLVGRNGGSMPFLGIGKAFVTGGRRRKLTLVFCGICLLLSCSAPAGSAEPGLRLHAGGGAESLFKRNRLSVQLMTGAVFSPFIWELERPTLNFFQTNLRLGWMLTEPGPGRSILRGCHELILELSHADIFSGPGHYLSGITPLGRYNFIQPGARLVPYLQGGVGIVYTDAYKDRSQDVIGQAFEFTPQFSLGLRYLAGKQWSVDLEGKLQHISNAGMSSRNEGVNGGGIFLGATYFLDPKKSPVARR